MTNNGCDAINNLVLFGVRAMDEVIDLILNNNWSEIEKRINERTFVINQRDEQGNTALIYAVIAADVEMAKKIIAAGADVNLKNLAGRTALMEGIINNKSDIIRFLIEVEETKLDEVDRNGYTALMYAVERNHLEVVESLYSKKVAVLIKNNYSKTALELVNNKTHLYIREFLNKRVIEIESVIKFLNELLAKYPKLEGKMSLDDLETLSLCSDINEKDFIMATYNKSIWNPVDVLNRLQDIAFENNYDSHNSSCSTDSEVTDISFRVRHDTSPNVEIIEIEQSYSNDENYSTDLEVIDDSFMVCHNTSPDVELVGGVPDAI